MTAAAPPPAPPPPPPPPASPAFLPADAADDDDAEDEDDAPAMIDAISVNMGPRSDPLWPAAARTLSADDRGAATADAADDDAAAATIDDDGGAEEAASPATDSATAPPTDGGLCRKLPTLTKFSKCWISCAFVVVVGSSNIDDNANTANTHCRLLLLVRRRAPRILCFQPHTRATPTKQNRAAVNPVANKQCLDETPVTVNAADSFDFLNGQKWPCRRNMMKNRDW